MKHLNTKTQFGFSILPFALCLFLILFSACDGGSGTSDEASSGTGSIIFSLQWEGPSPASAIHAALAPSGDVCVDYGIETIMADVYNSSNEVVASKSWPCSDRQGTISDVPIGSDMWIIVEGTVSDIVLWRGETTGITVFAGETTQAETVTMNYIGDDMTAPTVDSTNPTNGATDVSIYTAITATFSETMVSASVNTSTVTLKTGTTTVSGFVTYNSSTRTATFSPYSKLSSSTTYTATITTEVQDRTGNQMEQDYIWSFTTSAVVTAPSPPTGVSVSSGDGKITISWDSVLAATSYNIYWSTSPGVSKTNYEGSIEDIDTTSYILTGLTNCTPYFYIITAVNNWGESNGSNEVNVVSSVSPVPDTGQTESYTDKFGEDSDYLINLPSYIKLDSDGNDLENSADDWAVVRDNVTGLIWEIKTDDESVHDKDHIYTWQDADSVFINELNTQQFGGCSDWRIPTIKELSYLVNNDTYIPSINSDYFTITNTGSMMYYWSSTTDGNYTDAAWCVDFRLGYIWNNNKSDSYYVRAVCGGQ